MRMTLSRKTRVVEAPPPRSVLLRSRPLRNPSITWGPDKSGDMVIHVPLVKKPWMARFGRFLPTAEVRHIILDDIGADVWELCDGETSIDSIRRSIADKYKLNPKEAEASLVEHLKQLARRRLIVAVAGPDDPPEPAAIRNAQRHHPRKKRR